MKTINILSLVLSVVVFCSCGGASDGDPSAEAALGAFQSLRLGQVSTANSPVAFSAAINTRESVVVLGSNDLLFTADNSQIVDITAGATGIPTSAETADLLFSFSNPTSSSVDVTITRAGVVRGPFTVSLPNNVFSSRSAFRQDGGDLSGRILSVTNGISFFGCAARNALRNVRFNTDSRATARLSCNSPLVSVLRNTVEQGGVQEDRFVQIDDDAPCAQNLTFLDAALCSSAVGGETVEEVLQENPDLVTSIPVSARPTQNFVQPGTQGLIEQANQFEQQQETQNNQLEEGTSEEETTDVDDATLNRENRQALILASGETVFGLLTGVGFNVGRYVDGVFVVSRRLIGRIQEIGENTFTFIVDEEVEVGGTEEFFETEETTPTGTNNIGGGGNTGSGSTLTNCTTEDNSALNRNREAATLNDGTLVRGRTRGDFFQIGRFESCTFRLEREVPLSQLQSIEERFCDIAAEIALLQTATVYRADGSSFNVRGRENGSGFDEIRISEAADGTCQERVVNTYTAAQLTPPATNPGGTTNLQAQCEIDEGIETRVYFIPERIEITGYVTGTFFQEASCDSSGNLNETPNCFEDNLGQLVPAFSGAMLISPCP